MTEPRHILVVIDPTASAQPALERAAWLAKGLAATLELFICDYDPRLAEPSAQQAGAPGKTPPSVLDSHLRRLRDLAAPLAAQGIGVTVDARWEQPLHEGIVRKVVDAGADIVLKDTHYHSVLKRSIFSNTDWNLIRNCPAPLWLVKPRAVGLKPCFVAAVDPLHERDPKATLDHRILAMAKELGTALGGDVQVFHAFDMAPVIAASTEAMMMPIALPIDEITDALRVRHSEAVHALTDAHAIPRASVHIRQEGTREQMLALTEVLRADVIVMGAVSRSRLERLFVGSTAEDVLDKLSCDALIVKPEGFTAPAHA